MSLLLGRVQSPLPVIAPNKILNETRKSTQSYKQDGGLLTVS